MCERALIQEGLFCVCAPTLPRHTSLAFRIIFSARMIFRFNTAVRSSPFCAAFRAFPRAQRERGGQKVWRVVCVGGREVGWGGGSSLCKLDLLPWSER